MRWLLVACAAGAACGGDDDPCAAVAGACLAVRVTSPEVDTIDQLELDVLYGDRHATATTTADGGRAVRLPVATAVELALDAPARVGVVVAGKLGGVVQGTGAASATVEPDGRAAVEIVIVAPVACVGGSFYCGGDKVAGDPDTLYECNEGGVPLARGVCTAGCIVRPADDDTCRADGGPCVEGGAYCGGDKVEGDPSSLYVCEDGAGRLLRDCPDGCIVSPPGSDDRCR